jgi:hypothetical protein
MQLNTPPSAKDEMQFNTLFSISRYRGVRVIYLYPPASSSHPRLIVTTHCHYYIGRRGLIKPGLQILINSN